MCDYCQAHQSSTDFFFQNSTSYCRVSFRNHGLLRVIFCRCDLFGSKLTVRSVKPSLKVCLFRKCFTRQLFSSEMIYPVITKGFSVKGGGFKTYRKTLLLSTVAQGWYLIWVVAHGGRTPTLPHHHANTFLGSHGQKLVFYCPFEGSKGAVRVFAPGHQTG